MTLELRETWQRVDGSLPPSREYVHAAALDNIRTITGRSALRSIAEPGKFDRAAFIETLGKRFDDQRDLHRKASWEQVAASLSDKDLQSLWAMENSGGMPGVIWANRGASVWVDTAPVTPDIRRNLCYDDTAQTQSDRVYPGSFGNASSLAKAWGVDLLNPRTRAYMQPRLDVETDGSLIWLKTPDSLRRRDRALRAYRGGPILDQDFSVNNHRDDWGFRTERTVKDKFPPKPTWFGSFMQGWNS